MEVILIILLVIQVIGGLIYLFAGGGFNIIVFLIILLELAPLAALIGARQRIKALEDIVGALSAERSDLNPMPVSTPTPQATSSLQAKAGDAHQETPTKIVPGWRCECGHWNDGYTFKCAICYKERPKPDQPENKE